MAGLTGPGKTSTTSKLATIAKVYGPSANIYTDVLKISPTATTSEIREAFFCLRYANYQKLDTANPALGGSGSGALTSGERKEVEMQMDAITGAFQIVSDGGRRKVYDASLLASNAAAGGAATSASTGSNHRRRRSSGPVDLDASADSETDSTGFPNTTTTNTRKGKSKFGGAKASPTKLSPSKSDSISHLPIGQRRSVFRRRIRHGSTNSGGSTTGKSGMNASRRAVAKDVTGGLNTRPSPSESSDSIFGNGALGGSGALNGNRSDSLFTAGSRRTDSRADSIFTESTISGAVGTAVGTADGAKGRNRSESPKWADFGNDAAMSGKASSSSGQEARDDHQGTANNTNNLGWSQDVEDAEPLPDGVNNLNAREQLLFKNQMYLRQQKQQAEQLHHHQQQQQPHQINSTPSRLGSRYDTHERTDKYTDNAPALASPTGVEEFDKSNTKTWGHKMLGRVRKPSPTTTTDSNMTEEDAPSVAAGTALLTEDDDTYTKGPDDDDTYTKGPDDDDDTATRASSHWDDDTRTFDDATTYEDETTLGTETVGDDATNDESTWASQYEDDATSYATGSITPRTAGGDGGKYSPSHKKGTKPMPILKSGLRNALTRSESDGKRVTIHSHRGRGEESDDFSLFEGASCPAIPSFTAIQEEVTGTYTDFKSALHQVSNAFVISPDDIDRLADKIRDAKIELGENYHKQVKERQAGAGGGGKQVVNKVGSKQVKKRVPVVKKEMIM